MTHHEPVEIKMTLSESVPDALDTLHLGSGSSLRIWFLDDLTSGLPEPLPLLAAGVILRLRAKDDEDDSTVKLRPCRRSQLTPRWATKDEQDGWAHRIEGDWAGPRRVLAVSSVLSLARGQVARATAAGADLGSVFDARQLEFLDQCADLNVNPSGLTPLGPIAATKWKDVKLRTGPSVEDDLKVDAERWTVGDRTSSSSQSGSRPASTPTPKPCRQRSRPPCAEPASPSDSEAPPRPKKC